MRRKSFVDGFSHKKISFESLKNLLQVDYQRNTLCEIAIEDYIAQPLNIINDEEDGSFIHMENDIYSIYVIQSTNPELLDKISKISTNEKKKKFLIAFRRFKDLDLPRNVKLVDPIDWMNCIISHGINTKILALQFMRDLEFDLDN
jgi:hypothetical protein